MLNRQNQEEFKSPHPHSASVITQYFEWLMKETAEDPIFMTDVVYAGGLSSLLLLGSHWLMPLIGIDSTVAEAAGTVAGAAGLALSAVNFFAQHHLFGLPVNQKEQVYQDADYQYQSARASIRAEKGVLPVLKITAGHHYDAGYAEGYILGEALRVNIQNANIMHIMIRLNFGAPSHPDELALYLERVKQTIPVYYLDEMRGKVNGYNRWLLEHHPDEQTLSFAHYLLLHLLPDIRNYNPFPKSAMKVDIKPLSPEFGCTTVAMRVGDYTFIIRILDWPSCNVGKYMMQFDREIADQRRTIDIGVPILSGALTVLNERGLLIEMNVAHGNAVEKPQGMPAVIFNRYCAEHAGSVLELDALIDQMKPLGAYHLTATDGVNTKSYHFYQHQHVPGEHEIEVLSTDKSQPEIMVVANHGLQHVNSVPTKINHRDSDERRNNIHYFFKQPSVQDQLRQFIDRQNDTGEISAAGIRELQETCLQIARLALVNNCESVLCALFVYHHDRLQSAIAATDNLYAQSQELGDFKQLTMP